MDLMQNARETMTERPSNTVSMRGGGGGEVCCGMYVALSTFTLKELRADGRAQLRRFGLLRVL